MNSMIRYLATRIVSHALVPAGDGVHPSTRSEP